MESSFDYFANVNVLTALGDSDVTVVSHARNHASLIVGCRLSGSTLAVVPHRDLDQIDAAFAAADTADRIVVTDAVFAQALLGGCV